MFTHLFIYRIGKTTILFTIAAILFHTPIIAEDWPTYMHDAKRSGKSSETVTLPLNLQWVYIMRKKPAPAWPPPALHDFWNKGNKILPPLVTFDRTCHVVSSQNKVIFGSSSDGKVYCLDALTGNEEWAFFTEAPVRFAPTIVNNAVVFGSDDGYVYSVNIADGTLKWKYTNKSNARKISGNEHIVTVFPIRTDILYHNNKLHFGAGLFPTSLGCRKITLNSGNGQVITNNSTPISPQGYLILNDSTIDCPTGRFGNKTFFGARRGNRTHKEYQGATITVGNITFKGTNSKISGGSWSSKVNGKAYSCAFSNGRLFVTTDKGYIYCFSSNSGISDTIRPVTKEFPYTSNSLKQKYVNAAKTIVTSSGVKKGYCLILDNEDGNLAYELAKLTELKIVCVESDSAKVHKSRIYLDSAGVYDQVSVHHVTSNTLPYTNSLFNIVVYDNYGAGGSFSGSENEAKRVLRPYGGTAFFSSGSGEIYRKGEVVGAGEWTHNYNNPQNNPFSKDIHVKGVDESILQWFGKPGPQHRIDRHNRVYSPLWKNGILFVPGQNWMTAVDAYNGTVLWDKEIPLSSRMTSFRDAGPNAVQENYLYIASDDKCLGLTHREGNEELSFTLPKIGGTTDYAWGYVAVVDDILFGSAENNDIIRIASRATDAQSFWDNKPWAVSDYLFAFDRHSGNQKWLYKPTSGGVVNTTIAVGDGKIIFVESSNPSTLSSDTSRFKLAVLFGNKQSNIVALNYKTGAEIWRKKFDLSTLKHTVYLIYSHKKAIVTGTSNSSGKVQYSHYAFDGENGTPLWTCAVKIGVKVNGGHGEQDGHPVVVGDIIYTAAGRKGVGVNINDGQSIDWKWDRKGGGCGQFSATKNNLYFRSKNIASSNLTNNNVKRFTTTTRPGCWINMIPAGGLLNIPEYSSGCTCDFPIQTSLAYLSTADVQTNISNKNVDSKFLQTIKKPQIYLRRGTRFIQINVNNILPGKKITIRVVNVAGKTILKKSLISSKTSHNTIWNYNNYSRGIYLISLVTPSYVLTKKLFIVK